MDTLCHMKKYNIQTSHIVTLQIHSSIPNNWTKTLIMGNIMIYC